MIDAVTEAPAKRSMARGVPLRCSELLDREFDRPCMRGDVGRGDGGGTGGAAAGGVRLVPRGNLDAAGGVPIHVVRVEDAGLVADLVADDRIVNIG